ncbi:hypothetical protein [Cupriavidus sp. RAF12]|uniref:hypothetical protein n=1 Tax=Cupriavidus sp. RAF12 TaxID=3233050 RepID=UPI003F8FDEEF
MKAARDASEIVRFALNSLANSDLSIAPPVMGHPIAYDMGSSANNADERRTLYTNWILSQAFSEVVRGIRDSLEEAYFFLQLAKIHDGPIKSDAFNALMSESRKEAQRAKFPDLIASVNKELTAALAFTTEFQSLQKVRNCLEHRGGIVGTQDADADGVLTLSLPRIRVFYIRGTEEVELVPGSTVDPGDDRDNVEIYSQRVTRTRSYRVGERVTFTADEFHEISFACTLFLGDLVAKLPQATPGDVKRGKLT